MQTKTWHQKKKKKTVIYDLWLLTENHFVVLLLQHVHVVTEWKDKGQSQYIQYEEHDNL